MSSKASEVMRWGALRINRRRALTAAGTGVFAAFASMTVGAPAHAGPCSGPYETGWCGRSLCSGPNCRNSLPYKCYKISGYCDTPGIACWSSSGHTCCKCKCYEHTDVWYCYCHG